MWIELQNIHKHYGTTKANNGVTIDMKPGVIHGILGENGAGKSTLMKILAGYCERTSGSIIIDGAPVDYRTPAQALSHGIGMLYQDPLDFFPLSVLENFMLGQTTGIIEKKDEYKRKFVELTDKFEFNLAPDVPVKTLTIGERQQLEILRLLALGIHVLIFDEPTSGISLIQKENLFLALKKLAREGKSIILVSHKLEDVDTLCDRVTVLRQGIVTGEMDKPFNTNHLIEMMFGRIPVPPARSARPRGEIILEADRVTASGGRTGLRNCSVAIRQGEIVGLAGLEGSGQGVFLRTAAGLKQPIGGDLYLRNEKMNGKEHHVFKRAGVTFMPASRLEDGLIADLSITEHFVLQERSKGFFIKWYEALKNADKGIKTFRIKGTADSTAESLSGGNQQRLLLSFLPEDPSLLLLENPTRGLDMQSAHWVWQYLQKYSSQNTGIVFSSSELDEILMVSTRVLIFFDGTIIKDVQTTDTDINELGRAIAGSV
ncbi:ABC transporter ATP-binding protein [Thermodesulfobacteriota bacterium]